MRWHRALLVASISLLACGYALFTDTEPESLTSTGTSTTVTNKTRFLRAEKSTDVDNYSFKDIDRGDNGDDTNDASKIGTNGPGERAGPTGAIEKLKSSKTFKTLSRSVTRATNQFNEKISPVLPIPSRLKVWSNNEKPLSFVKKELGLNELTGAALTGAKNFKYYDDYVVLQLPIWAKKELTPTEVVEKLGLRGLSGTALTSNSNFKYYDDFVNKQVLLWGQKDLSMDDVLVRLELNTLAGAVRTEAVNYKYYNEFVLNQMRSWLANDVSVPDVMKMLNLNTLTGSALANHPNYKYYDSFVKSKLRSWATEGDSINAVAAKLGLEKLVGRALTDHPNYRYLDKYRRKAVRYQEEGWLIQGRTTFDIWNEHQVYRVKLIILRSSRTYEDYKRYVNMMDDHIIEMKESGFKLDDLRGLISKDATPEELHEKTLIWTRAKRPQWYVEWSLGLDGLEENLLKEAPNYAYYAYYLKAVKFIT